MDNYASFINEALDKTKCRECVPCWEEIQTLMNRQKMLCTVHYPGPGSCQLYISSHTTANEVWEHLVLLNPSMFRGPVVKNMNETCQLVSVVLKLTASSFLPASRWRGACRRSWACRTARTPLRCTSRTRCGSSRCAAAL